MGISRRNFLVGGLGLYATLSIGGLFTLAAQSAPRTSASKILVVVHLAGGNDGLNMVVPYADDAYYKARPTIGIRQKDVLQLNRSVGLHDGMPELVELFKKEKLSVIQGVGYPEQSRSHFRSAEIWQTGELRTVQNTGWLGRYLDLSSANAKANASDTFFPALNVDSILPKTLSAHKVVVPSVRLTGSDTTSAFGDFNKLVKNYKSTAQYPDGEFGKGMKFIAQMIVGGVDCKVYNITLNGFDTHTDEGLKHGQLLRDLSMGLGAFQQDLEAHNKERDALVVTFSEFGRRLAENDSRGTDHGTAAPMLVLGGGIKGGVIGDHPSLTLLDDGDMKYTTDFRSVYATLLERWLGADSKSVLGDKFDQLDLFRNV